MIFPQTSCPSSCGLKFNDSDHEIDTGEYLPGVYGVPESDSDTDLEDKDFDIGILHDCSSY